MVDSAIKIHVLLSTLATVTLIFAGFQAMFLMIQDAFIRKYKTPLIAFLPSIETLEKYLFRTLSIGWILLSSVILSSLVFFKLHDLLSTPAILPKTILTLTSWSIFSFLLISRYFWGSRGKIVIRGTFLGIMLLLLIYWWMR
jgi:ABC-type uncharacterized transport system permease subunit